MPEGFSGRIRRTRSDEMQNWIPIGAALAVVVYIIAAFNRLVSLRYRVRDAWAQIDVQLKRRHDLIPNLVSAVKGYMDHEREGLEGVPRARPQALAPAGRVTSCPPPQT